MKRIKKFFTLIELIVLIVVLGILAAIVIPNISSFKEEAKETAMASDGRNIQTAIDIYQLDNNGKYPTIGEHKPTLGQPSTIDIHSLKPEYIRGLPKNEGMYFWVDYQGKVYNSTLDNPLDFEQKASNLSWTINEGASGYDIYEVVKGTTGTSKSTKVILVGENIKEGSFIPKGYREEITYLISVVDQYGFNAAPVAEGYTGSMSFEKDNTIGVSPPLSIETPVQESELEKLALGDFVQFGRHLNGNPMKWNVVKKENGNVMLFMTEPIKSVDGQHVSKTFDVSPKTFEPTDSARRNYGSSNWEHSDIREWLNGYFYDNAFTEKDLIKDTNHNYVLATIDSTQSTTGFESHTYIKELTEVMQNYNVAYKKHISDKVFLVSIEELVNDIVPVIGNSYYNSLYWYVTRDAYTPLSYYIRKVEPNGTITNTLTNYPGGRTRAAITIDSGELTEGDGSSTNPYIIK